MDYSITPIQNGCAYDLCTHSANSITNPHFSMTSDMTCQSEPCPQDCPLPGFGYSTMHQDRVPCLLSPILSLESYTTNHWHPEVATFVAGRSGAECGPTLRKE